MLQLDLVTHVTRTEESSKRKIPGNIYLTYVNTMGQYNGFNVTAEQKYYNVLRTPPDFALELLLSLLE